MQLDSVVALRDSLFNSVVRPLRIRESLLNSVVRPLRESWLSFRVFPGTLKDLPGARLGAKFGLVDNRSGEPTMALGITTKRPGDYCLAVRVHQKKLMQSAALETITRAARGEAEVRYVGRITPAGWYRKRNRPLRLGSSVGHFDSAATGTITGFVHSKDDNSVWLLSNNHVLAKENAAQQGDAILQPGNEDKARRPDDEIGLLSGFRMLDPFSVNSFDCAFAELKDGIEFDAQKLYGRRRLKGVDEGGLESGTTVFKIGRSTGPTSGFVSCRVEKMEVGYYALGLVVFADVIEIEGDEGLFCAGGDSGSLIVDQGTGKAVAMLFAVSETGHPSGVGLGYATPLHPMLEALNVSLLF